MKRNEPPVTLLSIKSDRYHFFWKGREGRFISEPIYLDEGSYTFTWFVDVVEEAPFFQAKLLDSNDFPVTFLPPGEEGEGVGHHTVTVTIAETLSYRLQMVARGVN